MWIYVFVYLGSLQIWNEKKCRNMEYFSRLLIVWTTKEIACSFKEINNSWKNPKTAIEYDQIVSTNIIPKGKQARELKTILMLLLWPWTIIFFRTNATLLNWIIIMLHWDEHGEHCEPSFAMVLFECFCSCYCCPWWAPHSPYDLRRRHLDREIFLESGRHALDQLSRSFRLWHQKTDRFPVSMYLSLLLGYVQR